MTTRLDNVRKRRDFLFAMAYLKEVSGDKAAAEHFLERSCADDEFVTMMVGHRT